MAEREEDFLRRWSRRKARARRDVRRAEPEEPARPPDASGAVGSAQSAAEPGAAEPVEPVEPVEIDEAEIEKLDYDSDYTRFLKAGVPAAIQRKALRKLWASNPIFGAHDGLDDYYVTADFTDAARAAPNVASSWRPGAGYKTDEELAAEAEAQARASQDAAEAGDAHGAKAEAPQDREQVAEGGVDDAAPADERGRLGDSATAADDSERQDRDDPPRA